MALVLKTRGGDEPSVGSNPTSAAKQVVRVSLFWSDIQVAPLISPCIRVKQSVKPAKRSLLVNMGR